jgi:Protein of unknown function (DUF3443)
MSSKPVRQFIAFALSALLTSMVGCSSASAPSSTGPTQPGAPSGPNVATISVNGGLYDYPNGAFTSVTICVPGSTTQCQTIDGILVDTGSYGLRIEYSALSLSLPQQTDSSGNAIVECGEFGSGFTWGPVQTTDMTISGETAASLPIQIMGSPNYPDTDADAATCADGQAGEGDEYDLDYAENLGANGILGVGNFAQDCGTACTQTGGANPGTYYSCPDASSCGVTAEALSSQVVNPVVLFPTDNNGVIVELPGLTNGVADSATGSLVFGIGTESNNGLGSATIYDVDTTYGNFTTVFNTVPYSDSAFMDSGSEVLFFLDPTATGLPECTDSILYCPTSNVNLSATNEGFSNGNSGTVDFTIGNGDELTNGTYNAISILGAPGENQNGSLYFDWGLPFFFGTNVYTAIDGATTPAGPGPYVAY